MKRGLSLVLAALMAASVMFCGCAKKDDSLTKIKSSGVFVLGLDDAFPPMGFRDENNNITGFDIEVAAEVAKRMGVELKCQPIDWDSNVLELNSGNIDCIWNGLTITADRQKQMTFSELSPRWLIRESGRMKISSYIY